MTALFSASEFTASKAKPLPVVLLLDTSGSMAVNGKIEALNDAVRKMLGTLTKEESQANEFLVSVITFDSSAAVAVSPTSASKIRYSELGAGGVTRLDEALELAKALIEDKERTPSRAYRPLVVLVSDGVPTDERGYASDAWVSKLDAFIESGRSAKCDRMALGIGREAYEGEGRAALERFVVGTERQVFEAKDASEIHNFFRFVTMSVVTRSLSQNPNLVPKDSAVQPPAIAQSGLEAAQTIPAQEVPTVVAPPSPVTTEEEDSYW